MLTSHALDLLGRLYTRNRMITLVDNTAYTLKDYSFVELTIKDGMYELTITDKGRQYAKLLGVYDAD